jgi:DNA-binding transcriptional LysR family regulator
MRIMDWDQVRMLLALLRAKNLQEAGERLGVDRSTISRRVAELERQLGARLFVRSREGLRPTATAERLQVHAERMEHEAAAFEQAASAATDQVAGVVRVATTEAFAALLVAEGLLGLRQEHPGLIIELLGGNRPLDLERGEADVALRVGSVREAALRVRCVARMAIGLFAAPAYLRQRGVVRSPRTLAGHDVLLPAGELARLPETKWLLKRRNLRVVFRSSSMLALVAAAAAGLGLVPLPLLWGHHDPRLERAMVLDDIPKRPVWLVTRAGDVNAATRVVADRVAALFLRTFAN